MHRLLRERNQNHLEIQGSYPQFIRSMINFMTHHPGRDKRMDAHRSYLNPDAQKCASGLYYGTTECQQGAPHNRLFGEELDKGDRHPVHYTSDKNFCHLVLCRAYVDCLLSAQVVRAAASETPATWIVSPKSHKVANQRVLTPGWGRPHGFLIKLGRTGRSTGRLTNKLKNSRNQLLHHQNGGIVRLNQKNSWLKDLLQELNCSEACHGL